MTKTPPHAAPVSVVVPARNEASTIARVVETLIAMPLIDEVVVVDNGSTDGTGDVAVAAGARVVPEARPGMGHAIRAGFIAARNDWVMKVDADLDRFNIALFDRMTEARAPGIGLIKGIWQDPRDPMPMTRYLVMPALKLMFPGLGDLKAPNSGIYAFDRSLIALSEIVGDYAADLDVMLRVHAAGAVVAEVDIGRIDNNPRDPSHYAAMTETIMGFFLRQRDLRITGELVVLAEDAGQVIVSALGTLAAHARAGGRVSIYLGQDATDPAAVLRAALQPFPTVRIAPLDAVAGFQPGAATSSLRILAPYPATGQGDALTEAQRLTERCASQRPERLLMPPAEPGQGNFRVDRSLSIAEGSAIKSAALTKLGQSSDAVPSHEVFQSDRSRA
ncbi:glycosyltransferase [uncultured Roseovarius sp.]|uniref:glycosyltransferase family 2 protein n=1 Tax=uncultured Roseovarius sp. TaxID=293344 RepID=UPI0026040BD0|nr:glycosyltransferase [uncultured Roseovarius sp.]